LIATWLEDICLNFGEYESENEKLKREQIDSWPNLKYKGFFIENNRVFFVVSEETQKLPEDNFKN